MAEAMKASISSMLKGIDRYNPENLTTLEKYVEIQGRDNAYDLEANLAVLKLYQFNPLQYQLDIVRQILMKALTNLPHTDFVLCKCLIDQQNLANERIQQIVYLHDLLETCQFSAFWIALVAEPTPNPNPPIKEQKKEPLTLGITGFEDSIRKFICHVVNITYQTIEKETLMSFLGGISEYQLKSWMHKYNWEDSGNLVFISNQEENIKTKNITEKIDFDSVAAIMSLAR